MFGRIQEYQPENELFSAYLERVQLFFLANGVEDDKRVLIFLSVVGSKTYSVLRNLVAPTLPQEKTFAHLVTILKSHFEPKPVIIAESFHFHRRSQAMGESITEYLAELRHLSVHCSFGDRLEETLHDRLVCGLRSKEKHLYNRFLYHRCHEHHVTDVAKPLMIQGTAAFRTLSVINVENWVILLQYADHKDNKRQGTHRTNQGQ